ncbi:DUF2169 domain-containing protein [Pyxidicoccus fallax]|uniref:DUF2169 domain-containing protein n=1 Tax=Pyxidicoccus fallax TaxID=394095 RepID=A0A848LFW1_9BACT|nr:DUF2169 domain-containing protein [Pyxidicoccus fallax]NMO15905.1 DUF2169 domain-containing protein [Pyxidicoccus fallax]NPC81313.1 DUF2169 domain-containing protein [Pyxidicoccus fallax]
MLQLQNDTPFIANIAILPDERGVDTAYVTVKATFDLQGGAPRVAAKQRPLVVSDEFWGTPGQSSLKYASEVHLLKPHTDVVLIGEAHAPGGRPVESCLVGVRVGELRKVIQVFGDRQWSRGVMAPRISSPVPFVTLPLVYERAFGGTHVVDPEKQQVLAELRNPVGVGFRGKRSHSEMLGTRLPNLEDPSNLIQSVADNPRPFGVGHVPPSWAPRVSLAGTYNDTWRMTRAPYLPLDFKREFFQTASEGLRSSGHLKGGEPVELVNVSPEGALRFALPRCALGVSLYIARERHDPPVQLETVQLEPGHKRLCMLWRSAVPCDKKALKVRLAHIQLKSLEGAS